MRSERLLVGLNQMGQAFWGQVAPQDMFAAGVARTWMPHVSPPSMPLALEQPGDGLLGQGGGDPGVAVPEPRRPRAVRQG